jgi:hypothetical protein
VPGSKSGGRRTGSRRYLPVGYIFAAAAIAAVVLPTALRPPVDPQSSSAAFSPDAPPTDTPPEALLQAIRQASSSTAGGTITPAPPPEAPVVVKPAPPVVKKAVRSRCFGDPPRQTESLYSALCVPAWTGKDNGGATAPGVTRDEVRIGITTGQGSCVPKGPLPWDFTTGDCDEAHALKVWQIYFNDRFEFYGRKMRFVVEEQSITDENQQRASVAAFQQDGAFAITAPAYGQASAAQAETVRRHIIDFGSVLNDCSYYRNGHPYAYSFIIDGCRARQVHVDLVCRQFAGKSPGLINKHADQFMDYNGPRIWGLILYQDETHNGGIQAYQDAMAKCGVQFAKTQQFNLTSSQQDIAGTMSKMKAAGVTTIVIVTEVYTPIVLTAEASKIQYYPEYIQEGLEIAASARLYDQDQASHMVGTAGLEIPRQDSETDWYRGYKEVDPNGTPAQSAFRSFQQIAGGIQSAGPDLTPDTFWAGLQKTPARTPNPIWSIGGGYGPDDYTYMDWWSLIWWDSKGVDPNSTSPGAWQFVYFGKRFEVGNCPTDPVPWWDASQSFTSPPRGIQG